MAIRFRIAALRRFSIFFWLKTGVVVLLVIVALWSAGQWAVTQMSSVSPPMETPPRTYSLSFQTLQADAEGGNAAAQYRLGMAFLAGKDVMRDVNKGIDYLKRATGQNHPEAPYALGQIHDNAEGVPANPHRAAEWYQLAARLSGHVEAQFALGEMYYNGRGVPNDPERAVHWFKLAAEGGHPVAQYVMSDMYAQGWIVKQDKAEAYKWLILSLRDEDAVKAARPAFDGKKSRRKLTSQMSSNLRREAERRIADWTPRAPTY